MPPGAGETDRLTAAATVDVAPMDPAHPDAQQCLRAYIAELNGRFETGFDPSRSISAAEEELRPPAGLFLLASIRGEPIGCGALKFHGGDATEIKRMWVSESARGLGIGRRLLTELEAHAARHGATILRLETNATLTEAIELYRSAGYVEVAAFNDEPYAQHWFEKRLRPPATL
jgi:ribosomal protein S18 acetylase RimI-like enzyme